ncbi:hypothetical protein PoB_005761300 [Plakobranchus ocellatus]|uniref:Uncharacterized protein n=1 Tax=Plakobranchus ocellatus TaxID=259542 RepID=A0AAV4CJ61_9GAST|nr:hypothetical protein PoB_005761300 [Plakobranchus ocellatus]
MFRPSKCAEETAVHTLKNSTADEDEATEDCVYRQQVKYFLACSNNKLHELTCLRPGTVQAEASGQTETSRDLGSPTMSTELCDLNKDSFTILLTCSLPAKHWQIDLETESKVN